MAEPSIEVEMRVAPRPAVSAIEGVSTSLGSHGSAPSYRQARPQPNGSRTAMKRCLVMIAAASTFTVSLLAGCTTPHTTPSTILTPATAGTSSKTTTSAAPSSTPAINSASSVASFTSPSSPSSRIRPGAAPNDDLSTPVTTAQIHEAAVSEDSDTAKAVCEALFGSETAVQAAYGSSPAQTAYYDTTSDAGTDLECVYPAPVAAYISLVPGTYPATKWGPYPDSDLDAAASANAIVSMEVMATHGSLTEAQAKSWLDNAMALVTGGTFVATAEPTDVTDDLDTSYTPEPLTVSVTYDVTGPSTADITYLTGDLGTEQAVGADLPWSKTIAVDADAAVLSVTAQNNGSGSITCSITRDGVVLSTHTSTGAYAVVTCTAT